MQVFCQYRFRKVDHAYLTYLMLQRQLSHFNGRKLDHRQRPMSKMCLLKKAREHDIVRLCNIINKIMDWNITQTYTEIFENNVDF
jgi:hypothetical protein